MWLPAMHRMFDFLSPRPRPCGGEGQGEGAHRSRGCTMQIRDFHRELMSDILTSATSEAPSP